MRPLICKQCGGKINPVKMVCEYCGTSYGNSYIPTQIKYVIEQPNVHMIAANITVPKEVLCRVDSDRFSEHILEDMTHELAKGIAPFMTVDVEDDIMRDERLFHGRVRVLDPKFRFV